MSQRKRLKSSVTEFEQLSNEIIVMCFDYFDFYHLCESFSGLNQRFDRLIENEAKVYVDLESFSSKDLLTFCMYYIQLSRNNAVFLTTYKATSLKLILESNLLQDRFSHLKSLTVADMELDTLENAIFNEETKLYQTLERLSLLYEIGTRRDESGGFLRRVLSSEMSSLKYLNLNLRPYWCGCDQGYNMLESFVDLSFSPPTATNSFSSLETLIIGDIPEDDEGGYDITAKISFKTLTKALLRSLPKLKCLKINAVHFDESNYERNRSLSASQSKAKTESTFSKNLRSIYIWHGERNSIDENTKQLQKFFLKNQSKSPTNIKRFFINSQNMLQE